MAGCVLCSKAELAVALRVRISASNVSSRFMSSRRRYGKGWDSLMPPMLCAKDMQ
ncbi:hypothetical protein D3C72_1903540 [compost metagenome]